MVNLISVEAATVRFGPRTVLDAVSLGVQDGDRIGVLGLNGAGKSTVLSVLAGRQPLQSGRVARLRDTAVAVVPQADELRAGVSIRDVVLHRYGDAEHAWASDAAVRSVLDGLGLTGIGLDSDVGTLSGGERRRVALAGALITDARVLLLDEPTNHLDVEAIAWLADRVRAHRGAVVAVTHDRWFLDAIATRTWEVVDGSVLVRDGGYSDWVFARAERLRLDQAAEERRRNLARKELAWLRRGPPARTSKPRFRIQAAEALISDEPEPRNTVALHAFAARRLGRQVLELDAVTARVPQAQGSAGPTARPAGRMLLDGVTWHIGPGDRIGVVGVNGSGKTTLLRILVGELGVEAGRVRTGVTVRIGYLSQEVSELPDEARVLEAVTEIASVVDIGGQQVTAAQLAERFGFHRSQHWTPVSDLSGGERRRLQLLRVLMAEPNVLVLDEPTNDLDTDTLTALEDLLDSWPGTLLVVSHDRYLIERVTDDVVALFGDGRITHLPGGIDAYLARRRAESAAPPAGRPERADSPAAPADGTVARDLRKDLRRLDRSLESLRRRQSDLTAQLTEVASDHVAAAETHGRLRAVDAELVGLEEEWLAVAERLEEL